MATFIPYDDAGMASFQTEQFTDIELFAGDTPDRFTTNEVLDASMLTSVDFPLGSVVGRSSTGTIVMAHSSGTPVIPIGITAAPVKFGSTNLNVPIFRAGCFNADALTWHADYSTDLLKKTAFEAGYAGAAFAIKKPHYSGVFF